MVTEKQKANLQPNTYSADNQPANRGRKKGVPNRATVYKKILQTKMKVKMPDGGSKEMTVYEAIALGQAQSAMKGNTNAWKEIQDSIHGKQTEKIEQDVNQKVVVEFVKHDSNGTGNTNKG